MMTGLTSCPLQEAITLEKKHPQLTETNPSKKWIAAGQDRISELPDEILHHILSRLNPPKQAGQTIALSSRWRTLWSSYPVVEFLPNPKRGIRIETVNLHKFGNATIDRFSRVGPLVINALKLTLPRGGRIPVVGLLLDLAMQRKATEVAIVAEQSLMLSLNKYCDGNNLRFLRLSRVQFEDGRRLWKFIVNCPVLETLDLEYIDNLQKLQIYNLTASLKTVLISSSPATEIVIGASGLRTLCVHGMQHLTGFNLQTPPQLNRLEISSSKLPLSKIGELVSKTPSLRSLALSGNSHSEKKLRLSCPNLEQFELYKMRGLEEIELDDGSGLPNFKIKLQRMFSHRLLKCEISNGVAACRLESHFNTMRLLPRRRTQ